jgi:glutathione S-transferase
MKLIYAPASPYARKCRIIGLEANAAFEVVTDNPNEPTNIVSKHNPLGKVPALILDDGTCVFDSPVICEVFAANSATLIPSEFSARIDVKRWDWPRAWKACAKKLPKKVAISSPANAAKSPPALPTQADGWASAASASALHLPWPMPRSLPRWAIYPFASPILIGKARTRISRATWLRTLRARAYTPRAQMLNLRQ